jgi:hypothetical protein
LLSFNIFSVVDVPCPDTFFPVLPSWLHANDIRSWYG